MYDFVFNEEVLVLLLRVDMYDFVFNLTSQAARGETEKTEEAKVP